MRWDHWESIFRKMPPARGEDSAHDLLHVERVVFQAKCLADIEGAQLEIVVPAAWLHDCESFAKDSAQRSQSSKAAAQKARAILLEHDYPGQYLDEIVHAIEVHSFSAKIDPKTIEAKVVQDADRLDALGAIGISRCLMLGGELGRPLYDALDPFCKRRAPDDSRATLDHFYVKLLTLASSMQTGAGRKEAAMRTDFMLSFLKQLEVELER